MNFLLIIMVAVPAIEIFLMIKIGSFIGAINTILLIFLTAIIGVYLAKKESLNTLKSGFNTIYQNKLPIYEIISGAALAFAALLLILPGFATDILGLLIIFPLTRKLFFKKVSTKYSQNNKKDFINGEFEDIDDQDDRKL